MQWKAWHVIMQLGIVETIGNVPSYPRRGPIPDLYAASTQEAKIKVPPYSTFKLLIM